MIEKQNQLRLLPVMGTDLVAIIVSAALANYIRNGNFRWTGFSVEESTIYLYLILAYIVVTFFRNTMKDFWKRGGLAEFVDCVKGVTLYFGVLVITMFAIKVSGSFSRLAFGYFYVLLILISYSARIAVKKCFYNMKSGSFYTRRLVVLTTMDEVKGVLERLRLESYWNYKLKGLILLDAPEDMLEKEYCGLQVMGNYNTMYTCLIQRVVDEIFIHIPYQTVFHLKKAVETYEAMGLTVNLNVNVYDVDLKHRSKELRPMGEYYVITFQQSVVDLKMRVVKRITDIVGAIVGLIITGIVTIFLAPVLLLESPGSLFFSQTRVGLNGRRFKIYKFRSMYMDAEERKKELMKHNEMSGLMFKMENDPRITKVGAFIRKTSIDELPQFWNVLKGDMSLIGTRPPTVDEFEQYETQYKRRLSIKPGITGLWQATGRSDIKDFENVLALDLEYIDNWSISMDIKILAMTIFKVLRRDGAR